MHVRESGNSSGGVTLTGTPTVTGSTLTVDLSTSEQDTVNAMTTPKLDIDAGAVSDTSDNPIAVTKDNEISLIDGTPPDTVSPTFGSATYNTGTGSLTVTFSESISDTTVDLSKMHVRESGNSSGGVTLTGTPTVTGSTLTVDLSTSEQDTVNVMTTPKLDIDAGAVSDTSSNGIAVSRNNPISVADGTAPTFVSAEYYTQYGTVSVVFSEDISRASVDLSKIHIRESGESAGGSTLSGHYNVFGNVLSVSLDVAQRDITNALDTPQLDIDAGAVSDTSDNPIAAAADLPITIKDTIRPLLDSVAYSTVTGVLSATFNEPISTSVDLSKMHIRESGDSAGGITLTSATSQSVSGVTLAATLSATQKSTVNAMTTPQLDIDAGVVSDTSGNEIVADVDNQISVVGDTAPAFVSAMHNTESGGFLVTFNETIPLASVDLSKLHIRESGESSGGITLPSTQSHRVFDKLLWINLDVAQRDAINALDTHQLDIDEGAVSNISNNPIAAAVDLPIAVNNMIPPTFDSATYNPETGILSITFSEPISPDSVTLSKIHIRESGHSSGGLILTGFTRSVSGSTLDVTIPTAQRDTIHAMMTPQLDIDAVAVIDATGGKIAAVTDQPITVSDGMPPVFGAATYSTGTGILNATFSEPISAAVNLSQLHIRESGESAGGVTLTGVTFLSVSGNTLTVTLSTQQKDAVNAMTTPQLDIDAGAISDIYNSGIAVAEDQPVAVSYTIPPVFDSAAYHTLTGILSMTFSEPISETVTLSGLHVRESDHTTGGVNMTGAFSQSVSNSTISIWFSPSQRDAVNAMTTPQIDIDAGAVSDTSGNPIVAAEDQPISVTDGTAPILSSAAYSTISGGLRVTFSEPISTTVELSNLHIREQGQTTGGTPMTDVTFLSISESTLTVTLSTIQRNIVNAMTTPQLDIDAGAVSDTSGNQIAAAADQHITVNDTIPPVFDSATYHTRTGILNMTFNEPISTPAELSKMHIREQGQTSGGVNMTDASSQSVSGSTLAVTLSPSQRDAVNAMDTPQLDIDAEAILDTSGNPIAAAADQPISVTDRTPPVFSAATYTARTGILNMTFNESISDTVTLSGLHVRESDHTTGRVDMTGASSQSVSNSTLAVTLSPSQRDAVNAMYTPRLDIDAGAVSDIYDNPIEAAADLDINQAPTADAGHDQTVGELAPVVLDGTGSFDNDSAILAYLWSHTSGPSVTLNATDTLSPTFTSPQVTSNQEVVFTLTVTDNDGGRDQDTVTIFIDDDSIPPALTSIVGQSNLGESFIADTIVFRVTFSEDVTGVDSSDFGLSGTGTGSVSSVAPVVGSGAIYHVIVNVDAGGTFGLDLRSSGHDIRDKANNPLTDNVPETDSVYTASPTLDHTFQSRSYSPTVRLVGSHNINDDPDQTDGTGGDPYVELGSVYVDRGATCYDRKVPTNAFLPVEIDMTSRVTVDTSQLDTSRTGLSQVTYSCTDDDNNTSTNSRLILVFDRSPPVITAPAPAFSITLPRTSNGMYYVGDFGAPTVFDFSVLDGKSLRFAYTGTMDGVPVHIPEKIDIDNLGPGAVLTGFHEGTTVLTWTVSDIYGNSVTTTQNVTINVY